jgi:hypothetical protein
MSVSVDDVPVVVVRPWGDSLSWLWAVVGMQFATSASWGVLLDHCAFICRGVEHAGCARGRLRGWWWRLFAAQLWHAAMGRSIWESRFASSACDLFTRSVFFSYGVSVVAALWGGVM